MTVQDVLEHFGGVSATARKLKVSYQAVRLWVEKGEVPAGRQWQIQAITNYALTVDEKLSA